MTNTFIFMPKQIYLNLPVKDLKVSTEFYTALGFVPNPMFSDDKASGMMWGESAVIMLVTHEYYSKFTTKKIIDTKTNSAALIALSLDSKDEVEAFVATARKLGSICFVAEPNANLDFMTSYEVEDPDGHVLEPFYLDITKFPTE
jgi:uncharacterized protein